VASKIDLVNAAIEALQGPTRKDVAARMDALRASIEHEFSLDELRALREEGRRWPGR
jgi:hypothetical protein